jgi:hypothetical protein
MVLPREEIHYGIRSVAEQAILTPSGAGWLAIGALHNRLIDH